AFDLHFGAPHCTNAQTRCAWLVGQNKRPPECRVKVGKPMRVRISCRSRYDPLRPAIPRKKINCWILTSEPCQGRQCDTGKHGYQNRSMPWLEKEHCDLNV